MTLRSSRLPEGRIGQALAIAAPLCVLLVFYFAMLQPALRWYGTRQSRLLRNQQEIAHILAQQHELPQLRLQSNGAAEALEQTRLLIRGRSDNIADANLQSVLTILAANSGASLTSTAVLPSRTLGSLRRVGVAVNVTASWSALTDLLASIGLTQPSMIVDALNISGSATAGRMDGALQASFAVYAFRRARAP